MTSRPTSLRRFLFSLLALLLLPVLAPSATAQSPPAQNPANGNWYAEVPVSNFFEARAIATVAGGFIADLLDAAERQWVVGEFGNGTSTFIGLTDEATSGVFLWESGAPLNDTDWAAGQPTTMTTPRYAIRFTEWTTGNGSSAVRALIETPTQISNTLPTLTCTPAVGAMTLTFDAPGFTEVTILRDNEVIATLPNASGTYLDSVLPGQHRYAIVAANPSSVSLPGRCEAIIPDPDYRFHLPTVTADAIGPAIAPVLLDSTGSANTGYSLGVCFDTTDLTPISIDEGSAVLALIHFGSDIWLTGVTPEGVGIAAIYSLTGGVFLAPGLDLEVATITFEATPSATRGIPYELRACTEEVGVPPVEASVVIDGLLVTPLLDSGSLTFFEAMFRRADTNLDGSIDIADHIFLGLILFDPAFTVFPCREACDVNGDLQVDVADMISIVSYLFAGGAAPAAPFPECGVDPDPATSLGCAQGEVCP